MLSTFITAIVFAGVISAYIFLGRALTRQGNQEVLESRSRQTLYCFTQDVSTATAIDSSGMTSSTLTLYYPDSSDEITYSYNAGLGTLTRTLTGSAGTTAVPGLQTLFTGLPSAANKGAIGLSSFSFNYYDAAGNTVTQPAEAKQIALSFTCVAGQAVNEAQSHFIVASPRVLMKSKPLLGTPNVSP